MKKSVGRTTFKKIAWYGCVIGCVCLVLGGGYVFVVVKELQRKLQTLEIQGKETANVPSTLETGSLTLMESLSGYANFAQEGFQEAREGAEEFHLNRMLENGVFERRGGEVLIKKDVKLPPLLENHCDRYRCLQNRIAFSQIPSSLWKGLLGIEDYRFLQHRGVDPVSILRALIADIKAMSLVQGGSTLTQQLAKNLFLSNEKKLERKLREMIYALYLERAYSKEQIVTMYFNEVFWGAVGGVYLKGAHMASRVYFDKKPRELDDFEAAMLIGMLKGPYYYHPINHLERLKRRTEVVFNRLRDLKLVSSDAELKWSDGKWDSWQKGLIDKNSGSLIQSVYLTGENEQTGLEPYEKLVFLEAVARTRNSLKERTEGADIAVKAAMANSSCASLDCDTRFTYYSKFERDRQRAIFEERHQVGSILKPIIYQQLLEEGMSLEDKVSTAPVTLDLISGKWTPSDTSYGDMNEVTLKYAIQKSRNTPLIRASKEVGFDVLERRLLPFFPNLLTPLGEYPSQLLGAIELSLSELSHAYLKFFKRQCDRFSAGEAAYEDSLLFHLAQAEETTIAHVAGDVLKQSLIFGKTGTSNNGLDNWYIAYDGQNFYSIWFGVDSEREGKELKLYGSNSAFKIFQDFIQYRGKQVSEFFCR